MADFKIPPVSPLIGSSFANYIKAIRSGKVDLAYLHKVILSGLICGITSPFHIWERFKDRNVKDVKEAPVFIVGHWRSGTTFLHNLLCQDPSAGFISTFQSVFPENMHSATIFKFFMGLSMPDTRPSDNVKLRVDLPQEDEFSLENLNAPSFYSFMYFPENYNKLFDETVLFENRSEKDVAKWQKVYRRLIAKAEKNTGGSYTIIKNPANTGRIDQILKMYPKARFIHIYRNPVIVYLSTKKFFLELLPTLQLQKTSEQQIIDMIFHLYSRIMTTYFDRKGLIPENQLYEIGFEDFEKDPLLYTRQIYERLNFSDWSPAVPAFENYLNEQKSYKKNVYKISRAELDRILTEWDFAFKAFGYEIPENLEIY